MKILLLKIHSHLINIILIVVNILPLICNSATLPKPRLFLIQ